MRPRRGVLLVVAAAALWGTTGTSQALGPETSDPIGVGLVRLLVAGPGLVLIAAMSRRLPRPDRSNLGPIAVAAVGMGAYQPLFFTAVATAGVALGTVVAIGSGPILAGLIGWLVDGETPLRRWWAATALGTLGVALIVLTGPDAGAGSGGLAAAVGAGLAFAVYIVASRRVVGLSDPVGGTALVFALAALLSLPLLGWVELGWAVTMPGALMTLYLGLVATVAAYVLFAHGLETIPSGTAATASLSEPLTAALLGVALLGEVPGLPGWSGMALVLAGLVVLASGRAVADEPGPLPTKGWA